MNVSIVVVAEENLGNVRILKMEKTAPNFRIFHKFAKFIHSMKKIKMSLARFIVDFIGKAANKS